MMPTGYTSDKNNWTEAEIQLLKTTDLSAPELVYKKMIDRTVRAIYKKCENLGITLKRARTGFQTGIPRGNGTGGTSRADYGYQPRSQHPDWSKVRFG